MEINGRDDGNRVNQRVDKVINKIGEGEAENMSNSRDILIIYI